MVKPGIRPRLHIGLIGGIGQAATAVCDQRLVNAVNANGDPRVRTILQAGTDLNLAFDGHDPGFPVIDALDVHVALLAELATGRRGLGDAGIAA